MTRKNFFSILLIGLLVISSAFWTNQKKQIESYQSQQFADFHASLIQLSRTFSALSEVSKADTSNKLFNIAVNNELADLENVMSRIRILGSRIDSKKNGFLKEYSIQRLLSVIKEIEDITKDKGVASLNSMLSKISQKLGDVAFNNTNEISPQIIEELVVFMENELEKAKKIK